VQIDAREKLSLGGTTRRQEEELLAKSAKIAKVRTPSG
jgi:hypothetical protein